MTDRNGPGSELVTTFDGSSIAVRRSGTDDGVPLLVVNAIGATLAVWDRSLVDIEIQRPVVAWDHRGLHGSEPPRSPRIDAEHTRRMRSLRWTITGSSASQSFRGATVPGSRSS